MKLSEIIKTLDGSSQEARDAVAGLIVRLGSDTRRASAYRCYGKAGADAVHAFLDASGVAHDMAPSTFDADSVQFTLKDETTYKSLAHAVASNKTHLLAYSVRNGAEFALSVDPELSVDVGSPVSEPAPTVIPATLGRRVAERTMEIYRIVAGISLTEHPDATAAVEYAKAMVEGDCPSAVVPPAIAEVAVRYAGLHRSGRNLSETPSDLVFDVYPVENIDVAVRLARPSERIPVSAMLQAPLAVQMDRDEWDGPEPLNGYLYCTGNALIRMADASACEEHRRDLFVRVDAPLRAARVHEGVHDPLGTLRMSLTPERLYQYMMDLYAILYGVNVGMYGASRLAARGGLLRESQDFNYDECRWDDIDGAMLPWHYNAMALCALVFSEQRLDRAYTIAHSFVPGRTAPMPVSLTASELPEDRTAGLLKDELAAEWHAMFTSAGTENTYVSEYGYNTDHSRSERAARLERFRNLVLRTPASSAVSENAALRPAADDDSAFTPTSALVAGVTACMRSVLGSSYSPRAWPVPAAPEHNPEYAVSAVYTGMYTDLSPELGENSQEFPRITDGVWTAPVSFTAFIEKLRSDRKVQHRCSQRTSGTSRTHVVIVETAFSAESVGSLDSLDCTALRNALAKTFIETAVYRRVERPSFAAEMEPDRASEFLASNGSYVRRSLVAFASRPYGDSSDGYVDTRSLYVFFARDVYGRTYVVFRMDGATANVARVNFRAMRGLPVLTAARATARAAGAASGENVFRYVGSPNSTEVIDKYIAAAACANHEPTDTTSCGGSIGPFIRRAYLDAVDYDGVEVGDDYIGVPGHDWYEGLSRATTREAYE